MEMRLRALQQQRDSLLQKFGEGSNTGQPRWASSVEKGPARPMLGMPLGGGATTTTKLERAPSLTGIGLPEIGVGGRASGSGAAAVMMARRASLSKQQATPPALQSAGTSSNNTAAGTGMGLPSLNSGRQSQAQTTSGGFDLSDEGGGFPTASISGPAISIRKPPSAAATAAAAGGINNNNTAGGNVGRGASSSSLNGSFRIDTSAVRSSAAAAASPARVKAAGSGAAAAAAIAAASSLYPQEQPAAALSSPVSPYNNNNNNNGGGGGGGSPSPSSLPSLPFSADPTAINWTPVQVQGWLTALGPAIARYSSSFAENEIDGRALLDLTPADLDYLQIKPLAHRKTILRGVEQLRNASQGPAGVAAMHMQQQMQQQMQQPTSPGHAANNDGSSGGSNLVHWSHLQPLPEPPKGGRVALEYAASGDDSEVGTSNSAMGMGMGSDDGDLRAGHYDEAAEAAAFKAAVMAWRTANGKASSSSASSSSSSSSPPRQAPAQAQAHEVWVNPFASAASSSSSTTFGSSAFSSSLLAGPAGAGNGTDTGNGTGGGGSLLSEGDYDEEAQARAFREAVMQWRSGGSSAGASSSSSSAATSGAGARGEGASSETGTGERLSCYHCFKTFLLGTGYRPTREELRLDAVISGVTGMEGKPFCSQQCYGATKHSIASAKAEMKAQEKAARLEAQQANAAAKNGSVPAPASSTAAGSARLQELQAQLKALEEEELKEQQHEHEQKQEGGSVGSASELQGAAAPAGGGEPGDIFSFALNADLAPSQSRRRGAGGATSNTAAASGHEVPEKTAAAAAASAVSASLFGKGNLPPSPIEEAAASAKAVAGGSVPVVPKPAAATTLGDALSATAEETASKAADDWAKGRMQALKREHQRLVRENIALAKAQGIAFVMPPSPSSSASPSKSRQGTQEGGAEGAFEEDLWSSALGQEEEEGEEGGAERDAVERDSLDGDDDDRNNGHAEVDIAALQRYDVEALL